MRLKCGGRDLHDGQPLDAVNATVHVMESGGLGGGGHRKQPRQEGVGKRAPRASAQGRDEGSPLGAQEDEKEGEDKPAAAEEEQQQEDEMAEEEEQQEEEMAEEEDDEDEPAATRRGGGG